MTDQPFLSLLSLPLTCGVQRQLNSSEALDSVAIPNVTPYGTEQEPRDHLTGVPE